MNDPSNDRRGGSPFAPFRLPHFGFVWSSNLLHFFAIQVHLLSLQWLVTDLTDSRTILGLAIAVQGVVVAIGSPLGGVAADLFAKRNLVAATRLGTAGLALTLAALVHSEWIALWHVLVAALLGGLLNALGQPASQAYVFDVVGARHTQPAIALNSSAIGLGQMGGPALAGFLIAAVGLVGSWSVGAASFAVAALLLLRIPIPGRSARATREPWRELKEGLAYVVRTPPLALALLACAMAFFNGAIFAMRPVFARHVLEVGSQGMGALAAAAGFGTLLGSLVATMLPDFRRPGLAIAFSMLGFSSCVFLYAFATSFPYLLCVEFASGLAAQIWQISAFSGLQMSVPERMRGRVMGLLFTVAQLAQVGGFVVGSLADQVGDRAAMATFGAIPVVALTLLLIFGYRPLSRLGAAGALETE
ncbi:MAG: MFS transporter [Myxococcota bacterium]